MNPRLAEIIARRKELADLVKRAADMEELEKYKQELKNLQDEEALIIERARIADELAGGGGNQCRHRATLRKETNMTALNTAMHLWPTLLPAARRISQ